MMDEYKDNPAWLVSSIMANNWKGMGAVAGLPRPSFPGLLNKLSQSELKEDPSTAVLLGIGKKMVDMHAGEYTTEEYLAAAREYLEDVADNVMSVIQGLLEAEDDLHTD